MLTNMKAIYTIIAALAFIGLFVEKADGSMPVYWTFGCLAALYLAARGLQKIFDKEDSKHFSNQDEVDALIRDLDLEEIKPGRDGSAS